ncbi:hypothetical protein NMG60_11028591 [Bertholletia excelsa]
MAVEFCSENSGLVMSPRISFSHDLAQFDVVPVEPHLFRSNSSTGADFDFCVRESSDHDSSSADELFAGGKILPTQIKKKHTPRRSLRRRRLHDGDEKKSFWRFKRSRSLNCASGYAPSLCPLPLLSRSNSTGSASSSKRGSSSAAAPKPSLQKSLAAKSAPQSSTNVGIYQRPPVRKMYGSNYGNGVRVNPVLNVPSGNLFGLGSVFFNGKDKNKKK